MAGVAGYHPSMGQADLNRLQWELLPTDRRWLSLCGRLLVTLNALEEDVAAFLAFLRKDICISGLASNDFIR